MGEVIYLADRLIPHWEYALRTADKAREVALMNLAKLTTQQSGQLELDYDSPPTPDSAA